MVEEPGPEPTLDRLLDGRLLLRQPARGHRAGTDAVLLAAAADPAPETRVMDLGAGVGTVGLALALRVASLTVHLVEIDEATAALARENACLNGVASRVHVDCLDIFDKGARKPFAGLASLVVSNPPFFAAESSRAPADPARARAHVLLPADAAGVEPHGAWVRACASLLAPHGRLVMIHRPDALPGLLAGLDGRLGGVRIRPVHAREDRPAIRILLAGTKGSRAKLELLPPIVLHEADGSLTRLGEALHRGTALISMG